MLNVFAKLSGQTEPIHLGLSNEAYQPLPDGSYSLNSFFGMHLFDFEVGHKEGLVDTLSQDLQGESELEEFERGFEFLLEEMDAWWLSLASGSATHS